MKKEFLDQMYLLRSKVLSAIELLEDKNKQIKSFCSHCESESDENMAELRTRRSQLSSLDDTISGYIKYHK